jgi:hypothetical protein
MRLIVLSVMGLIGGLGLAAAIVSVPVKAEKGPLRTTLVAHLGGGLEEEEVPGGGDPDGRGRAVVKVFEEQLCGRVETRSTESSSSTKATIHLGMSGEVGPTVANLQEERAARTPLPETTTPTTTTTTMGTTGTTTGTTGTTTGTTTLTTGTTGTTTGTTTATTGATGAQQAGTTTTGDTTSPQAILLRRAPRCRRPASPSLPPPRRLAHQRLAHQRLAHRRLLASSTPAAVWRCLGH